MSLWNFLGNLAIFNIIRNWFSNKPQNDRQPIPNNYDPDMGYYGNNDSMPHSILNHKRGNENYNRTAYERLAADMEDYDAEELQSRIDDLESQLDGCDETSDYFDMIQDEIDMLQDQIDDFELNQEIYNDFLYDNDSHYSDAHDDFYRDENW